LLWKHGHARQGVSEMGRYIVTLGVTKMVEADDIYDAETKAIEELGLGINGYEWDETDAKFVETLEE